ncbi:hypothetical protein G6F40_013138 [Rhizopus arrhizus]|nr:hypothetical protein G6F40_013138 [Rhizopus arrhizus]
MSLSFEYSVPVVHSTQSSPPSGQVRRLWNLSRLKEPEVLKLYVSTFGSLSAALLDQLQQLCASPPSTRPPIDHLNDELNAAIYSALDKSVGSRVSRSKHWKKFWTSQLQALADRRDWLYRKWRWSLGIDKAYWWGLHQEAHVRFRTAVKRAKRESWRAFCDSLARGDFSSAVRRVKQVHNRRRPQVSYAHPDGPVAGANAMRDHLASVYSGSGLPSTRPPPLPSSDDHVPFDLGSSSEDDPSGSGLGSGSGSGSGLGLGSGSGCGLSSFSADSVADTMRRLPLRKAPGSDHLRTEMLIPIRKQLAAILARLFDICCQWSYTPSLWRHAQVVPIYKKGDPHQPSNFRPISLTSIIRKLFEMCLFPHLEDVSPPLDIAQGGFRPQRTSFPCRGFS